MQAVFYDRLRKKNKLYSLQIDHVTFQKQNDGNRAGEKMIDEGICVILCLLLVADREIFSMYSLLLTSCIN